MLKKMFLLIVVTATVQLPAYANNMFLKIEGVEGESLNDNHRDEIDILSWSWGAFSEGRSTCVQDISLVKSADKASPQLLMGQVNGAAYPNATLTVRTIGEISFPYIQIEFKNLAMTSVASTGTRGESRLAESITFSFEEATYKYSRQRNDGSFETPISATIRPNRCK